MHKPITIMVRLIGLISSLIPIMLLAIVLGWLGHLSAILIPTTGFYIIIYSIQNPTIQPFTVLLLLIILSVLRGVFRYGEQMSNHYIAFKVLAQLRHMLLKKMQSLAFVKLQGKHKGELISMLTSDVELLEVFYAHTISPIAIATLVGLTLTVVYMQVHYLIALIAIMSYIALAVGVPAIKATQSLRIGHQLRDKIAAIHSAYLDLIRGIRDINQYGVQNQAKTLISETTLQAESSLFALRNQEALNRILSDGVIVMAFLIMMLTLGVLVMQGHVAVEHAVVVFGIFVSSFGPFIALSQLSNNLHVTLACGQRVLDILDEQPQVKDIIDGTQFQIGDIEFDNVTFAYQNQLVLRNTSLVIKEGMVTGLLGPSGQGKSTIAKLICRFYEPQAGEVRIQGHNVNSITTTSLLHNIAYMSSKTDIVNATILDNIRIGRLDADFDAIVEASKQASLHEFVMQLPQQYDTLVHEGGDRLSEGEKQRIGLARCFLSQAPLWILDEPTSNIDSLNEAVILQAIHAQKKGKTILVIAHRQSTLSQCDALITLNA